MICLNDLALETNKSLLGFFADDLIMTVTGTSVEGVAEALSIDANRTVGWCGRNGKVAHTGKIKAMLVSTVQRQPTLNQRCLIFKLVILQFYSQTRKGYWVLLLTIH